MPWKIGFSTAIFVCNGFSRKYCTVLRVFHRKIAGGSIARYAQGALLRCVPFCEGDGEDVLTSCGKTISSLRPLVRRRADI